MTLWPRKPPPGSVEIRPPEDLYLTLEKWPEEAFESHFHDAFNWLVPMRPGEMVVEVGGEALRIDGNHWVCIFPNTSHTVRSVSDGIEVMSLFLSHEEMAVALGDQPLSSEVPYIVGGKGVVAQGLALLWAESRLPETESASLRPMLAQFLCSWIWAFHGKATATQDDLEMQLKLKLDDVGVKIWRFLDDHVGESPFPWDVLAAKLTLSLRTFQRLLGSRLGKTPTELLTWFRVEYARKALRDPDVELADIALKAGFSSQSHFSTVFKTHTGLSPGQFRVADLLRGPMLVE